MSPTPIYNERSIQALCLRKVCYFTRRHAKDAQGHMRRTYPGETFELYRCPVDPKHFHVGHPR